MKRMVHSFAFLVGILATILCNGRAHMIFSSLKPMSRASFSKFSRDTSFGKRVSKQHLSKEAALSESTNQWKYTLSRSRSFASNLVTQNNNDSSSPVVLSGRRVYFVTKYGADPTGTNDSSAGIMAAINDALSVATEERMMPGVRDLGGAEIHLEGGNFRISSPIRLPPKSGNLVIHGGTLRATKDFPGDRHLIELWDKDKDKDTVKVTTNKDGNLVEKELFGVMKANGQTVVYEAVTIRDLMLDSSFRGGGILVINGLRTLIENCYISHFSTTGIQVQGGHETFIRDTFIGQYITAGGDPREKQFSGTAIALYGNDNAVTDVVIFSADTGILVTGQANIFTGVHCYNKATGWGGVGIKVSVPGITQTRIVGCYMDYTGIVTEDPVQLDIVDSFFLGDAFIKIKSGGRQTISGVTITNNMFSGQSGTKDIVQLEGTFHSVDQTVVDQNSAQGMKLRSTVAAATVQGNGTSWTVDFGDVLLFPDHIRNVQYSLFTSDAGAFPRHVLRNVSHNKVIIESDVSVSATVSVQVDQSATVVRSPNIFSAK